MVFKLSNKDIIIIILFGYIVISGLWEKIGYSSSLIKTIQNDITFDDQRGGEQHQGKNASTSTNSAASSTDSSSMERLPTTTEEKTTTRKKKMADGCYHVYLDVGSNLGVHARFLMEPHHYPQAKTAKKIFNSQFGRKRDNRDICVFTFEPNPNHRKRQLELQAAYNNQTTGRWGRYIPIQAGVGDQDGTLTFYHDGEPEFMEWGFSFQKPFEGAENVTVPLIRLSDWLLDEIKDRQLPTKVYNPRQPPRVVMKLDIEMMEFYVLPDIITSGALCSTIDYTFGEFHFQPHFFPFTTRNGETLIAGREDESRDGISTGVQFGMQLLRTIHNSANCKTTFQPDQDDEVYLRDGVPLPGTANYTTKTQ